MTSSLPCPQQELAPVSGSIVATRLARAGIVGAAIGYIILYLTVALIRLRYPFELEWLEGAMVDQVQRLVEGRPMYAAPSLDFVPFIYPPLFFWASAAVAKVTGLGFLPLRAVSLAASLVVLALIYRFVETATRDRVASVAAAGLFAATYAMGGTFLDLGRVDSLFVAVLLGGLLLLRDARSSPAHAVAGAVLAVAVLTKQSAAVMAAPAVLYATYRRPRAGLAAGLAAAGLSISATVVLDLASHGWYHVYVLELLQGMPVTLDRAVDFLRVDMVPLAIAWALGLAFLLLSGPAEPRLFAATMAAGLISGSWLSRSNMGGFDNVLIPAFAAAAILFGLGLNRLRTWLAEASAHRSARGELWLAAACLVQFAALVYNPVALVPTAEDAAAGRALVQRLATAEGEVWIPSHGHIATMAGKRPHAHWMAIDDVVRRGRPEVRDPLQRELDAAVAERKFAIIVRSGGTFPNPPLWAPFYADAGPAVTRGDVLWPVAGALHRPDTLLAPTTGSTYQVAGPSRSGPVRPPS